MKLTSWEISKDLEFIAICGPTYDNEDILPFNWSTSDFGNSTNHFGLSETFKFQPIHVHWSL